jgi:enoyl-[acyl-carrier protein] reductase II
MTNKPFGVSIPLDAKVHPEIARIAIEERVPIVHTSVGDPRAYTQRSKAAGMKVLHTAFCVRHALVAEAAGVDAVIASGVDGGGMLSSMGLTTMALVPQVVDAVKIPVIAGGGIADARGIAACFALGAEGVVMGTRFMATQECPVHPRVKEAIVKAKDTDTAVVGRAAAGISLRALKSPFVETALELMQTMDKEKMANFLHGGGQIYRGLIEGDMENNPALCGLSCGLISDIPEAAQVIERLVEEFAKVVMGMPKSL